MPETTIGKDEISELMALHVGEKPSEFLKSRGIDKNAVMAEAQASAAIPVKLGLFDGDNAAIKLTGGSSLYLMGIQMGIAIAERLNEDG